MLSVQKMLLFLCSAAMTVNLTACGVYDSSLPDSESSQPPSWSQEILRQPSDATQGETLEVTQGTENYRGFQMDSVLHAPEGDIHFHIYVPETYNGSEPYALFLTLPGYEGLYFQGVGQNLYSENFAFEALNYNDHMIVAAPQLSDWGETSAEQTIALTEYCWIITTSTRNGCMQRATPAAERLCRRSWGCGPICSRPTSSVPPSGTGPTSR